MILIALTTKIHYCDAKYVFTTCILKICCGISLNIAINMVTLQPKFHSKQVIDGFVDEVNLIRQQNRH
jgi:hypothetical protein